MGVLISMSCEPAREWISTSHSRHVVQIEGRCLTDGACKSEPPSVLLLLLLFLLLLLSQLSLNVIPPLLLLTQGGRGHDQVGLYGCSGALGPSSSNPSPTPWGDPVNGTQSACCRGRLEYLSGPDSEAHLVLCRDSMRGLVVDPSIGVCDVYLSYT